MSWWVCCLNESFDKSVHVEDFKDFENFVQVAAIQLFSPRPITAALKRNISLKEVGTYMLSNVMSLVTPLKTNMEPENGPLEKEKHLQITSFWVPCLFSRGYI